MVLKYQISPYPALLMNMVVRIWEAQSDGPGAHVYEEVIPERNGAGVPTPGAGHQVPTTIEVNGLDKVVHIVRLYTATATLLHEYNVEPLNDMLTVFDPISFKIGDGGVNTPGSGTNQYINILLNGLNADDYTVFRNNYGFLIEGTHYNNSSDPVNGGFTLAGGDVFGDSEEFWVHRKSVVNAIVNDSVVGKWFKDFFNIAGNINYDATHLRKLMRFQGAFNYTFAINPPVGYAYVFQNFSAADGKIIFANAPLEWGAVDKSEIIVPRYCECAFAFDGLRWNVVYFSSTAFMNDASAVQPGQNVAAGNFLVATGGFSDGDVPAGTTVYTVTHNLNITGDYLVLASVKTNNPAVVNNNTTVMVAWHHHATLKKDKFHLALRETNPLAQNVSISWLIVKL
jgi:hypothetical protein